MVPLFSISHFAIFLEPFFRCHFSVPRNLPLHHRNYLYINSQYMAYSVEKTFPVACKTPLIIVPGRDSNFPYSMVYNPTLYHRGHIIVGIRGALKTPGDVIHSGSDHPRGSSAPCFRTAPPVSGGGSGIHNQSNIEAVLIKRQPDSPQNTKKPTEATK